MDMAEKTILFCFLLKGVCCNDFSISLPEKIEALSGSCVIINCSFEIRDDYDQFLNEKAATGVWLKDGTETDINQVFNSRNPKPGHLSGKITGNLHEKNCTTIFYDVSSRDSGSYYFRIMSEDLKNTYTQSFSTINVIESPPKPRVQLYVDEEKRQDQEEVLEGSSVSLRCSAETLCSSSPATLTWSSTPRIPLNDSSRLQELISDLKFTATHREHRVTFTCTITYQIQDQNKTAQDSITLHVQYSPKDTSVSVFPSSSVLEGSSVTLSCSSESNPAVMNYTWSREREGQLEQLQTGQNLTFNRTDPTHRGWYHCTAQNQHGAQNSSVMLDIHRSNHFSVLIGVAVVALAVVLLCAITCICVRKWKGKLPETTQEGIKRRDQDTNDVAVYAMMSPAGAAAENQDAVIYSPVVFTKKTKSQEVRSVSSRHAYCSAAQDRSESEEKLSEDSSQLYAKVNRRDIRKLETLAFLY
ncbi:sialic acid-binding Ig-like lectin 13 [Puntigrus tetrazona]|uniref:sialic acid-binding Ig-like lectin 13 n=1 Tax=Puntigrus tetrazona TaxID=1606681 RepID=UPI001C89BF52|nr:sialic acid-binding Ig-like lectin 13 [Puntigrus tetrazona]